MSAWEQIPTLEVANSEPEADWEEYMRDTYRELRYARRERKFHDRNGFLALDAGSAKCIELGHVKPEGGWEDTGDELHVYGFGGTWLCRGTEYGSCCTQCEGECSEPDALSMSTRAEFWELVTA